MQKLKDLDRKTKHAHMRTQSSVFYTPSDKPGGASTGELVLKRKAGAGKGTKAAMGGIMSHDEGPYAKLDWPSKKGQVAEKPSAQNEKKLKR